MSGILQQSDRTAESIGDDPSECSSVVDVCIFIDPLYDFLSPNGVFCATYGEVDCEPILSVTASLNQLYYHLKTNFPSVHVIVVSSIYEQTQFRNIHNLCTSPERRKVMLEGCPVDENNTVCDNHTFVLKCDNSLFSCSEESLERVRHACIGRNVLVCGVTTVSCVAATIGKLRESTNCKKIVVAANAVASRKSNADRETKLMTDWKESLECGVEVCEQWQHLPFAT